MERPAAPAVSVAAGVQCKQRLIEGLARIGGRRNVNPVQSRETCFDPNTPSFHGDDRSVECDTDVGVIAHLTRSDSVVWDVAYVMFPSLLVRRGFVRSQTPMSTLVGSPLGEAR